jgi:hypothetical protein
MAESVTGFLEFLSTVDNPETGLITVKTYGISIYVRFFGF